MADGTAYSEVVANQTRQEVFLHFEEAIYRRLDQPTRQLLLDLSPFETFDSELAKMVSGDSHVGERLGYLQRNSTILAHIPQLPAVGAAAGAHRLGANRAL